MSEPAPSLAPVTPPRPRASIPWIENRAPRGWLRLATVRELWSFRELAYALALKDLSVRYKQTFFGIAWAVLQPVLAVIVFTVLFDRLVGVPADGLPYAVFAYAGMILWLYVAGATTAAALSLVDNRELVSKVYFPRGLAPLAAVVPGLVDLAASLAILVVLMVVYGVTPGIAVLLTPLWIAAAALVAIAVGFSLCALNVKYRDVKHALGLGIQLWFFATPVVYPSSLVESAWRYVYALNPMVGIVDGFRWSVLGAPAPGGEVLVSLGAAVVLAVAGVLWFHRVERHVADLI